MSEATLTAVNRPSPLSLLLDLTRRLAEEFHTVPIPMVTRVVKSAAEATRLFGDDVAASLGTIEQIARQDLAAIGDATEQQKTVALTG
jgi:hypothetical protein